MPYVPVYIRDREYFSRGARDPDAIVRPAPRHPPGRKHRDGGGRCFRAARAARAKEESGFTGVQMKRRRQRKKEREEERGRKERDQRAMKERIDEEIPSRSPRDVILFNDNGCEVDACQLGNAFGARFLCVPLHAVRRGPQSGRGQMARATLPRPRGAQGPSRLLVPCKKEHTTLHVRRNAESSILFARTARDAYVLAYVAMPRADEHALAASKIM